MRTVFLAVLALLVAPGIASAAPFSIGPGTNPSVAVDAAGVAYIAYDGLEAGSPAHFCRLPRGASACDVALTLPFPVGTDSLSRPVVAVAGPRVTILQHRYGQSQTIRAWLSVDGGVTFPSQGVAGGNVPSVESVAGPGDTVTVVSSADSRGALLQNVPLDGSTPAAGIATLYDGSRPYNGTVGLVGSTPLALFADLSSQGAFRRYTGTGDINNAANWTASTDVGFVSYPRLAGGPSGLFLISGDESFGLFVRRFDGTSFGARVPLTDSGDASEMFMTEDPAGRLQAVWSSNQADGFHVVHAVSDDGVSWQSGTVSVQTDDEPGSMRIAAAPDHVGVAAWTSRVATGSEVRLAATGPGAPGGVAPPPPPPPVATPTPAPPVATPVPEFHKSVVLRPVSGKVRVRLKGSKTFVDLSAIDDIPLGSTVDTKHGRVGRASVPSRGGPVEKVQLYDGQFSVAQKGAVTEFALNEALASCSKRARVAAAKPKTRKLWGDGKGKFRTKGSYSAATVRGTQWLVQDSCAGTLTRVTQGTVVVSGGRKPVIVRAGKRYLVKPHG